MPAAIHNFSIEQGSNFFISFEYLDGNNIPIDLTNYCIILKFRDANNSANIGQYSSNVTNAGYKLRKNNLGVIEWVVPYTETRTFDFNTANYDLILVNDITEEQTRLCTGTIQIIKTNFPECDGTSTSDQCKGCVQIDSTDAYSRTRFNANTVESITFVAPFDGFISSVAVTGGQSVAINTTLLTLSKNNTTGGGTGGSGNNTNPTGIPGTGNNGSGINPDPPNSTQEDLCDYLCQGLDLFGKLYSYNDNFVVSDQTSGNFNIVSNQSTFKLPDGINYVSGILDVYINGTGLSKNTQYVANDGKNFSFNNLSSLSRTNGAISGDIVTWINKGIAISDMNTQIRNMHIHDTGLVSNLEITINNLKHSNPQDLALFLVSPHGDTILLSAYNKINNYSANNGLNFTFSNKATSGVYLHNRSINDLYVNIYDKSMIYNTNNFPLPDPTLSISLDTVNGKSASGIWSLIVQDHDPGASGTIEGWNLIITYPPTPFIVE